MTARRLTAVLCATLVLGGGTTAALSLPDHDGAPHARPEIAPPAALPVVEADAATASPVALGKPIATLRIPALGKAWAYTVREGVRPGDLAKGPGHYPGTPLFGEPGNVAVAGHRWDGPFYDFERLHVGDLIRVEQGAARWTYEITTEPKVIEATDVWVVDPLPGFMLTLTTCWPKSGSSHREYVRARLIEETHTP